MVNAGGGSVKRVFLQYLKFFVYGSFYLWCKNRQQPASRRGLMSRIRVRMFIKVLKRRFCTFFLIKNTILLINAGKSVVYLPTKN